MNRVARIDDRVAIRRVLISVSDKTDLQTLVDGLAGLPDVVILSTGGTYDRIGRMLDGRPDAGRRLLRVSDYTGQPEMQGGLVKTLDFRIYLGILSEPYNEAHDADRERAGADLLDMVVVNLYPFRSVSGRAGADAEDARGNIDIGGPAMLRAAAKSYLRVAAVCDPADYRGIIDELKSEAGALGVATRYRLAQKAFGHTAQYDRAIADYLAERPLADAIAPYELEAGSHG